MIDSQREAATAGLFLFFLEAFKFTLILEMTEMNQNPAVHHVIQSLSLQKDGELPAQLPMADQ